MKILEGREKTKTRLKGGPNDVFMRLKRENRFKVGGSRYFKG